MPTFGGVAAAGLLMPMVPMVLSDNWVQCRGDILVFQLTNAKQTFSLTRAASICGESLIVTTDDMIVMTDDKCLGLTQRCSWSILDILDSDLNHKFFTSIGKVVLESLSVEICWLKNKMGSLILLSPPKVLEDSLVSKIGFSSWFLSLSGRNRKISNPQLSPQFSDM